MKVAVDARMINNSGIGTCIQNWMKNGCYDVAIGDLEEIIKFDKKIDLVAFTSPIYGIKEQLKFPYRKLKKMKIDVLHVPHYNIPLFYRGKMIVTIHDLTHLILPEFLPNKFALFYAKFMLRMAVKRASTLITVSENTKNDILNFFKVDPNKIEVVYNGVGDEFIIKPPEKIEYLYKKYNIPKNKKILMYVGNMKPHKNLLRLLEAFSKLKNIDKYRLVLVGKSFINQINLQNEEGKLNITDYVIHTGIVSQEELVDFYNLSDLFVFPSLYEGFGLPIIEALSCGTNVVCSNTSSMPEVGGKFVNYFDPNNTEDITKSIEENVDKKFDFDALKWVERFKWQNSSKKIEEICSKMVKI